jgi:ligand-binding sensor domain-containing protein/signal transduction histidine kinase
MRITNFHSWLLVEKEVRRLFLITALCFPLHVFSQLHDPFTLEKFKFHGVEQIKALENRSIGSMVQDDYGFMWFGTLDGLIRFDGYEVRLYKNDVTKTNSLANNTIEDLAKDNKGNLWIATQGGGLDKFEIATERFTHYQHNPADTSSIANNSIFSVLVDSRGMVWVGTFSDGLQVLDLEGNKFRRIKEEKYRPIRTIIEDRSGMIWFGSNGINRVDPASFNLKTFPQDASDTGPILRGEIKCLYQDKHGKFWVAVHDEEKIFHFDPETGKYSPFPLLKSQDYIHDFCEDNAGRIWVATNNGLAIIDNDQISYYQSRLSDNDRSTKTIIIGVYSDKEGNMWLGTEGEGLRKVHARKNFNTFHYDSGSFVNHRFIRSLCEDDQGRIWIGWIEGGIDIFDPRTNNLKAFDANPFDNITFIYQDNDGSFWIGTWDGGGLLHYTSDLKKFKQYKNQNNDNALPDDRIQAVLRDHQGILWVATENGLSQFDEKQNLWKPVKKPYFPYDLLGNNAQSLAMVEAPDGTLWAGTCLGLNAISPDRKKIKYYSLYNQFDASSAYHVTSLCLDQNNNILWIGTYGSGLNRLDIHTGEITQITEKQGLPSNTIFGIEQDDEGHLWMSTINGMSEYNPDTGHCRNYDTRDGLQANEFNWGAALETRDGRMYFGGSNGLNMFNPSEITNKSSIPTVAITDFEIFNKPVNVGDSDLLLQKWLPDTKEITLSYEQSVFTFGFAALDYTRPEKNQYAYMLEGFDKDWNYVGNKRSATYTSIDPGEYTFRVKASNDDGVWNEAGTSMTVIITPPFWLTWWFKTISAISVIGSLLTFYFVRMGTANRQRAVLEYKVNQRTKEISAKNEEILSQNEQILTQMEKVKQLSEEIAQQRDNIELQNNMLAGAKVELEKKVNERTNELSLSNNELMRQNVQLEQFAFMTAHNLRSPVARLLGLTAIFNNENPNDAINTQVINRVQKSAVDLDEVIKDIAKILQVQEGTKHRLEPLSVYPAIAQALKVLNVEIDEHKINIINKIAPDTTVYGVPAYVNSVFYNIINNAVKYADLRKKPLIEIGSVQDNGNVSITFTDNGIGFDSENMKEKLFKPFSRLNAKGDGKGLGLYLVKIEMESMNGDVNIESKVDNGTKVTLKFNRHAEVISRQ